VSDELGVLIWLGAAVICIAKAMEEYSKEKAKEGVMQREEKLLNSYR